MKKTIVVTDTASCLTPEQCQLLGVELFELPLCLGEKAYQAQNSNIKKLLRVIEKQKDMFFEGQVSLNQIDELVQRLKKQGYQEIIWIHLSRGISGLGSNLAAYVKHFQDETLQISLFDACTMGPAQGELVKLAADLVKKGVQTTTILEDLAECRNHLKTFLVLGSLNGLKRTGSISNGVNFLSNAILKPKTLLTFTAEGQLEVLDTHLRLKKIAECIEEYVAQNAHLPEMSILGYDEEKIEDWQSELEKVCGLKAAHASLMPETLAAYAGVKSILISWI